MVNKITIIKLKALYNTNFVCSNVLHAVYMLQKSEDNSKPNTSNRAEIFQLKSVSCYFPRLEFSCSLEFLQHLRINYLCVYEI